MCKEQETERESRDIEIEVEMRKIIEEGNRKE